MNENFNGKDLGEYPKIERYKKEKSKMIDLQKTFVDTSRSLFSVRALAFRFPKYKHLVTKSEEVVNELKTEIEKSKENLIKYGQPSKRVTDEAAIPYSPENDRTNFGV